MWLVCLLIVKRERVDSIVPNLGEPRLCPGCGRWLRFFENKYLCMDCWLLFEFEETLEHSYQDKLCYFVIQEATDCLYYVCTKCGKTLMVSRKDVEEHDKDMEKLFGEVDIRREEKLTRDEEIRQEIENLRERDSKATERAFLRYVEEVKSG